MVTLSELATLQHDDNPESFAIVHDAVKKLFSQAAWHLEGHSQFSRRPINSVSETAVNPTPFNRVNNDSLAGYARSWTCLNTVLYSPMEFFTDAFACGRKKGRKN